MSMSERINGDVQKIIRAWESKHCGCDGPEETGGAMFICRLHETPYSPPRERVTRIGELIEALRCIP